MSSQIESSPDADVSRGNPRGNGRGLFYLVLGTALFAASFSVIAKMVDIGRDNLIDGRNPISFCNVLFAGNIVAGLAFSVLFFKDFKTEKIRVVKRAHWGLLVLIAFLEGGLAPAFIFIALEEIPVASVVLVQSIQIPLVLLAAWVIHKERSNKFAVLGALIAVAGLFLMVGLKAGSGVTSVAGMPVGVSELRVAVASFLFVLATQLRRRLTWEIPIGVYAMVRTVAGTIFFAIVVLSLFGPKHFVDIFSPTLWKWMLVYGIFIVAAGQTFWHLSLRTASAAHISLAEAATPVLGIGFAFLILQQAPTTAEMIGGTVVIAGVFLIARYATSQEGSRLPWMETRAVTEKPGPFTGV
ncbi:MAG: DMT family transporter [Verrucomicrobiota bacterium]